MNFFAKKSKQDNLQAYWDAYFEVKEQKAALEAELDELKEKILKETEKRGLYGNKQTATFGTFKVSYTDKTKLIVPKKMDIEDFRKEFPTLCRAEIDEKKVLEAMSSTNEPTKLNDYGFDVEIKREYQLKKV